MYLHRWRNWEKLIEHVLRVVFGLDFGEEVKMLAEDIL